MRYFDFPVHWLAIAVAALFGMRALVLPIWQQLLVLAAAIIINEYTRPKPKIEDARPAATGDFKLPTATEGRAIPLLWGTARIEGPNVVWHGDIRQEAIVQKIRTGLWSSKRYISGFRNFIAWQQVLCRGLPNGCALLGVWIADKKVFTGTVSTNTSFSILEPELFGGNDQGNGGVVATVDFFVGTASQPVSTYLNTANRQRVLSASSPTAPRYTGTCYMVVRGVGSASAAGGAYIGNSTKIDPWTVEVQRFPGLFTGQTSGQNRVGTHDANPINVVYEYLTNTEWGRGISSSKIDIGTGSSFVTAAATMVAEGNGFSLHLEREIEDSEFLLELERQIGGVVFFNLQLGKWQVKLVRDDYDIDEAPVIDESNASVISFSRAGWEDTTNQVQLLFSKRIDDYKESYAIAQDMANAMIRGGGTIATALMVPTQVSFPGVKDETNAARLAWRELRSMSYPLARLSVKTKRELWNLTLGSVFAWSSQKFGVEKMPMRVLSIDYGTLDDNAMTIDAVEDVFYYEEASYGVPQSSQWVPHEIELLAIPVDEQIVVEAPRAIVVRDEVWRLTNDGLPHFLSSNVYVWCAAVRQSNEVGYRITFFDSFIREQNVVEQFMKIGDLATPLVRGQANPVTSIDVTIDDDISSEFDDSINDEALGFGLVHLIQIGAPGTNEEFVLCRSASWSGGTLTLSGVFRGVLDSVQREHTVGTPVYFLFLGAALMRGGTFVFLRSIGESVSYDFFLRTVGLDGEMFAGSQPSVTIAGGTKRAVRPYPPAAILYNGSSTAFTTPSLEGAGSGLNGFRIDVRWWRRHYNTVDEVASMLSDDASVDDLSTEYRLEVRADPDGANLLVGSISAWTSGAGPLQVSRLDILTAAAAGTKLRFLIRARHDYTNEIPIESIADLESRNDLAHDVTPTSSLTNQFYFGGGLAANVASNSYTAVATGTFTLNIGAAQSTAAIQVSIDGGAWNTVIAAGLTTGTFSASTGEQIRVRRTVSEAPNPQFVELRNPSSTAVAYGTFLS